MENYIVLFPHLGFLDCVLDPVKDGKNVFAARFLVLVITF